MKYIIAAIVMAVGIGASAKDFRDAIITGEQRELECVTQQQLLDQGLVYRFGNQNMVTQQQVENYLVQVSAGMKVGDGGHVNPQAARDYAVNFALYGSRANMNQLSALLAKRNDHGEMYAACMKNPMVRGDRFLMINPLVDWPKK